MSCNCVSKVNESYAASGRPGVFVSATVGSVEIAIVELLERNKHGVAKPARGVSLLATFCPFCGKRYQRAKAKKKERA